MTLDELSDNPANAIYTPPIQPHNAPITLPIAGAGFLPDTPPKIIFATPDRLDISVDVIKNEFVRCVAAKTVEFDAFNDFEIFWNLKQPELDSEDYGQYGIGSYTPPLLGSEMYAPREDIRQILTIHIEGLLMATRYAISCATSPLLPSQTTADDSSQILSATPIYQSTRGNTEGLLGVFIYHWLVIMIYICF